MSNNETNSLHEVSDRSVSKGEEVFKEAKRLCEKEGKKGWLLAQHSILKEETNIKKLQDMIEYVAFNYPPDYFRPALLSFCSKAVGGSSEPTIPTSAALTLLGWAIGIHDDIIDQSRTKNRHQTVLGKFGKDYALIMSDILFFKGFTLLRKTLETQVSVETIIKTLETINEIWFEQSEGEILEVESRGKKNVKTEQSLEKIRMRASELEACTRIGGILGGGTRDEIEALGAYGRLLGMMAILRNELIDMLEFQVLKRRIKQESLPLPLVHALQREKEEKQVQLISMVSKPKLTKEDLYAISKSTDQYGGMKYVANMIVKMGLEAKKQIKNFESKKLEILANSLLISPKDWTSLLQE